MHIHFQSEGAGGICGQHFLESLQSHDGVDSQASLVANVVDLTMRAPLHLKG